MSAKTTKTWKLLDWPDSCPYCGDGPEILTVRDDNLAYDGDEVRCASCHMPGYVSMDDDHANPTAYINWHEEPGCTCEWCKAHPEE